MKRIRIILAFVFFMGATFCGFAYSTGEILFESGLTQQKLMTIESQKEAIRNFKKAEMLFDSEEKKQECRNAIKVSEELLKGIGPHNEFSAMLQPGKPYFEKAGDIIDTLRHLTNRQGRPEVNSAEMERLYDEATALVETGYNRLSPSVMKDKANGILEEFRQTKGKILEPDTQYTETDALLMKLSNALRDLLDSGQ